MLLANNASIQSDYSYCTECQNTGYFLSNPSFGRCVLSVSECDNTYGFVFLSNYLIVGVKSVDSLGNVEYSC